MRSSREGQGRRGMVPLEILAVVAVMSVLLGLGVIVVRGARHQAHLAQAQSRLKQVSTALELYFKKYGRYPAAGKDLSKELEEFIADKTVFENPLKNETKPGETLTVLYQEPTTQDIDKPETYLTAFVGEDGKTGVVLKTNGKIVLTDDLDYTPGDDTDAKVETMTLVEDEADENDGDGVFPSLAIFVHYDPNTKSNRGHGNNLDHDDYDNPGQGGGGHGTEEGFVPDDSIGYDDDEMKGGPYRTTEGLITFGIVNTTEAPNDAAGVCVEVAIVKGEEYVQSLEYSGTIGDLAAGESKPFPFDIKLNNAWKKADADAEVFLTVTITAETNCPKENVGKKVEVLVVK